MSCTSSTLCSSTCGSAGLPALPAQYYQCDNEVKLSYGWCKMLLMSCDHQVTDLSDPNAIASDIASGKIVSFPLSNIIPQTPSSNLIQVSGCGREDLDTLTYTYNVETFFRDCDGKDSDFFCDFQQNASTYRVILIDRHGHAALPDEWIDALDSAANTGGQATVDNTSAGFAFSVTQVPYIAQNGDLGVWNTSFQIKTGTCIRFRKLPSDVLAVIG